MTRNGRGLPFQWWKSVDFWVTTGTLIPTFALLLFILWRWWL